MQPARRVAHFVSMPALLLVLGAAGCADDRASIFIQQVSVPVPGGAAGGCKIDPTPTNPTISSGILDIALAGSYNATFLVANQMITRGDRLRARAETDWVNLQGAEIRITDAAGNEVRPARTVPGAGSIPPGADLSPSYGLIGVTVLDSAFIAANTADLVGRRGFSKTFVTFSSVFGETTGGTFVQSGDFEFPISVCWGCLLSFPPDADDPATPGPDCDNAGAQATSTITCEFGQDFAADCRTCRAVLGPAAVCEPP